MSTGKALRPGQPSSPREQLVLGLQVAAALLMAQQIAGKAARDGLFLLHYGPQALPAMIAGAAGFSVLLSLISGKLMHWLTPRVLAPWALAVSGALQVVEWWLLGIRPGLASVLIYLQMAGLGAVLLSLFWSILNEEFDPREAKRRFGRIAAGGTIGGLLGGIVAERTVAWSGAPALMLIMAGLHLTCGVFLAVLLRTHASSPAPTANRDAPPPPPSAPHKSSLLVTLGSIVLLGAIGAALLDYAFKVYATETWGRGSNLLRFFAFFHAGVALFSFLMQTAASKVFLEKFGLGKTILALPATLAGGSFLALLFPGALIASIARAAEAAVRGSLFRAGYETCYTPVPAAEKRLAKTFIDVGSERGGDALGAALVFLCLKLAGQLALPWILSIAALVGLCSLILCRTLDAIYVKALARSLESNAVQVSFDSEMDLTTRSLIMPSSFRRTGATGMWGGPGTMVDEGATVLFRQDATLRLLSALRSSDKRQVNAALTGCDVSDPLVATQVCLLLGHEEHALLAHSALFESAGKVLGLLTDLMLDPSLDVGVRRRIPRIIGSVGNQRAADALFAGLQDRRFEVRLQCARTLAKSPAWETPPAVQPEKIIAAVDRELTLGTVLWESRRKQEEDPSGFGAEWLDELLSDKANGSLEYVFALLSMLYDKTPLMAAYRSLHVEDRRLRGTALEYLEGILPPKTRELLWDILQERPSPTVARASGEIMENLLNSSETVVLHLRRSRIPPAEETR